MHRRRLLAVSAAGLVGTAGCTADGGDGNATATPTPTPAPTLSVTRSRVLPSVVALNNPDSINVIGDAGTRYPMVTVDASDADDPPAREAFSLSVGDETHEPLAEVGFGEGLTYFGWLSDEGIYGEGGPVGDVPFAVPRRADAPAVTLSWPGGQASLDAGDALARPTTTFEVVSFEATGGAETASLSVTVRNTGDARGWFVGAINVRGPSVAVAPVDGVAVAADPGERVEWTSESDPPGGGSGEANFTLRTADGDHEATATLGGG